MYDSYKTKNPFSDRIASIKARLDKSTFVDGGHLNAIKAIDFIKELVPMLEESGSKIAALEDKLNTLSKAKDGE